MIWVVVLVKDFGHAKQRLRPALTPPQRRELAERNARLALAAAQAGDHVLAVCAGEDGVALARNAGVEWALEDEPAGQNPAARRGIGRALAQGADAVLLLSSDLPLVTRGAIAELLEEARAMPRPAVLAAPATGRGGTNALFLSPPDAIDLHFGDDSLGKFERDARARGVAFALHERAVLALDLDEPSDLEELARSASEQPRR
ncbi:MAG: 2-phospho-L-lactate guanylyltransferase [Candidatus Dormibacteraceae bacterium]